MQYKKKPLLYKIKQLYEDSWMCDYRGKPIILKWIRDFKYWFKYQFISPVNVVKIKTLPKGPWVDRDEILLHVAFQVLVDFVERECDNEWFALEPIDVEKNMESYKDWDEADMKPMREQLEAQNKSTKEIKDLYDWWKVARPIRVKNEPIMVEEYPDFGHKTDLEKESAVITRDEYGDPLTYSMEWISEKNPIRDAVYKRQHEWEEMSEKEDEEMLIRLMKIRRCLWT